MILTVGSLFSGIGGIDLGLERAGMRVIWQSEIDPYASQVLARHWPDVPNLGDITRIDWSEVPRVDLICGGFPCQDISSGNTRHRAGLEGARSGLWSSYHAAVVALRPTWVVIENSPNWQTWMPTVRAQLADHGYATVPLVVQAGTYGAPHKRPRGWVVAHADSQGEPLLAIHAEMARVRPVPSLVSPAHARALGGSDGVPARVDRLRALGNAVVPQVAEHIGRLILEADAR